MRNNSVKDRAVGAIMGTLIGDALGLGCHWYYDLDQLKADFGEWVSKYNDSRTDRKVRFAEIAKFRYEEGLRAGDVSQTRQLSPLPGIYGPSPALPNSECPPLINPISR